jgi:hypothetical protein
MDSISFNTGEDTTETVPSPDDSVITDYLKGIPDQDRAIVEKYVKPWDANVTKKFQSIHDSYKDYKPFKEQGISSADLDKAYRLFSGLRADPVAAYKYIQQELINRFGPDFDKDGKVPEEVEQEVEEEFDLTQLPEQYQRMFENMQSEIGEFKTWREQQEQAKQDEEENKQIDSIIDTMHNLYGEFDDRWILLQLADGAMPEQAIASWKQFTEGIIGSQSSRPAPPRIPGGQGGIPNDQVDVTKLDGPDRRKLIADILERASSQG